MRIVVTLAVMLAACSGGKGGADAAGTGSDITTCEPACKGKACGEDGCGGQCGECGSDQICSPVLFRCVGGCSGTCDGKNCGDDGCGHSCGACPDGQACGAGVCGEPTSCTDGKRNGSETDVDCGGTCPTRCGPGKACSTGADCGSGTCDAEACVAPQTCSDGNKDGKETDVDCGGGECKGCAIGRECSAHSDCLSLACIYGVCDKPTCTDGAKNQTESDIDCGGTCSGCKDGKACNSADDCAGNGCEGGKCCTVNSCGVCSASPVEVCDGLDNDCNGQTDEGLGQGKLCPKQKGVCAGARERCAGKGGWVCDDEAYASNSWEYGTQDVCNDGADNDCDGLTDYDDKADCCLVDCGDRICGDDGCGGSCGTCTGGKVCAAGACVPPCQSDPSRTCHGVCGTDASGVGGCYCDDQNCDWYPSECCPDYASCCKVACQKQCQGKQCGDDGCNGVCGKCDVEDVCQAGKCVTPASCDPIGKVNCCKGSTLYHCVAGTITTWDCYASDEPCGWDTTMDQYQCGWSGTDPAGKFKDGCPF